MAILDKILETKRREIAALKQKNIRRLLDDAVPAKDFLAALPKAGGAIIAEIKKASPSAGVIVPNYIPSQWAELYAEAGASAISILTDATYFQGDLSHINQAKNVVDLPVLRKDFILDEEQVFESRVAGADAILLIARILPIEKLSQLLALTYSLGMEALVEVNSTAELDNVLTTEARLIGINSRDLNTFQTDLATVVALMEDFPELNNRIVVAESGIDSYDQIEMLMDKGIDAFLVGTSILKSEDPAAKIQELLGGA